MIFIPASGLPQIDLPGVEYFAEHTISIPCGWWVTDESRSGLSTSYARDGSVELSVLTARECGDDAIPAMLGLVDQEFLRSKSRPGTIAKRYPSLFTPQNAENLYLAWYGRQLAGTVVVKKFDWLTGEGIWKGAMLGLVCVAPCFRRRGVGTDLIQHVVQRLEHQAVDFAVSVDHHSVVL